MVWHGSMLADMAGWTAPEIWSSYIFNEEPLGFATYAGAKARTTSSQTPSTTTPPASLSATGEAARRRWSGRDDAIGADPTVASAGRLTASSRARP